MNEPFSRTILSSLLVSLLSLIGFTGCSSYLSMRLEAPTERRASLPKSEYRVGTAKVDITPMPGYPMAGYGIGGRFSRGYWSRLFARSIYIEDSLGTGIVLVICDLWGMPAGLAESVTAQVQRSNPKIGREHLVIAATHTHNGPGNFASSATYNFAGSIDGGFDATLFQFLVGRIAESVLEAAKRVQPALLSISRGTTRLTSRNRSLAAYRANPERPERQISAMQIDFPEFEDLPSMVTDPEQLTAVDSSVIVLRFDPVETSKQAPIALAVFYACHPTAMGPTTEVYSSDFFGVAANIVEQSYRTSVESIAPVVAIFNGAEGDVTANWTAQNIMNTLRLGKVLARSIQSTASMGGAEIHGPLKFHYEDVAIPDRRVVNIHNDPCVAQPLGGWKTACSAVAGVATLGGAVDARTFLYNFGMRDGVAGKNDDPAQGKKYSGVDAFLEKVVHLDSPPLRDLVSSFIRPAAPEIVGLGIYSIGDVLLATLPGEFTTTLGSRISKTIHDASKTNGNMTLLVGLANEYLSYFTTPCEYDLQLYEGSSMLYGQAAGTLIEWELGRMSSEIDNKAKYEGKRTYAVGNERSFGISTLREKDGWQMEQGLANILLNPATGLTERRFPQFSWSDSLTSQSLSSQFMAPVISIEESTETGWRLFVHQDTQSPQSFVEETDTSSVNFVSVVQSVSFNSLNWRSIWLTKSQPHNTYLRFCVRSTSGVKLYSEKFRL